MKHLDNENLKTLEKETEEDARSWKGLPCSVLNMNILNILAEYVQYWEDDCTLTVMQAVE